MNDRVCQNVLLAIAEPDTARPILAALADRGIRGTAVADAKKCCQLTEEPHWAMVMVDGSLGDGADLVVARARMWYPERPLVMLGPAGATDAAVAAVRAGCSDYLPVPPRPEGLAALLQTHLPGHDVPMAAEGEADLGSGYRIAGVSEGFLAVIEQTRRVAPTSMPVLISGESGTGKELLAYLIHRESRRARQAYVRVNCASLSESLLESELFGHERGAFTGAHAQRKGRFERAHGGTLLLDEISETGPRFQAELLRVMEQQDFERVGGHESIRVNVRVISTSNRDLAAQVAQDRFRRDLHYRIAGVHLVVPPLRERLDDIPVLVWHFVNQYAAEVARRVTELDPAMLKLFASYYWPGNVRQLRNLVRAALIFGKGSALSLRDTPSVEQELRRGTGEQGMTLRLEELERQAVMEALRRTSRNQVKAAQLLGISDRTLREKLRRYRQDDQAESDRSCQFAGEEACQ
ncbi:MAG: sigma-54 dependent transcriptional regulator [Planctomycetota bacterium]|nr:sigma-54 dependent transcriptional regulator [Planctomycetota bacterium]